MNDDIRVLKQENKKAFAERMKLEAQKNKLENLLTNNLNRRKDELVQALQEISVEDRKRQLENTGSELLLFLDCPSVCLFRFPIIDFFVSPQANSNLWRSGSGTTAANSKPWTRNSKTCKRNGRRRR